MAIVKYVISKNEQASITYCPYRKQIRVGSEHCRLCKYFNKYEEIGLQHPVYAISCNYAEDVASRNKKPQKQKSDKIINPVKFKCICGHNQYTCLWSNSINPRTRAETVRCNKCKLEYKLEFTLTNQIVPYQKRK